MVAMAILVKLMVIPLMGAMEKVILDMGTQLMALMGIQLSAMEILPKVLTGIRLNVTGTLPMVLMVLHGLDTEIKSMDVDI